MDRLNELAAHFENPFIKMQMMKEFGDSETAYSVVIEDGETVLVSIFKDHIIVQTHQKNGWVRINEYDENGTFASETYDGRWK